MAENKSVPTSSIRKIRGAINVPPNNHAKFT